MPETDFQKIFESLTMPWFYSNPIFFKLFCMQKLKENTELQIPFRVGKNLIEYNPTIVGKKNKEAIRKELLLELKRIILHHPFRCPENDKDFDKELWYEASTMTITQKGVAQYGFAKDRDIDYYYEMLRQREQEDEEESESEPLDDSGDNSSGSEDSDSNQDSFGTSASSFLCDEASTPDDFENAEATSGATAENQNTKEDSQTAASEKSFAKEGSELWSCDDKEAEKQLESFMENNSESWGTLPDNIEEQLSLLAARRARIPSCVKLLEYFKSLRANNDYSLTRMRPSRRFGYNQMGKKRRAVPGKILIGIDVSGSISDEQIIKFYHAISNVFDRGIKFIEIFQFDAKLKTSKPLPYKKRKNIEVYGRGGTCFQPIFDYTIKNQNIYDGLIIFTDGYAAEPVIHHKLNTKVLWVLHNKTCYLNNHETLSKTGLVTVLC